MTRLVAVPHRPTPPAGPSTDWHATARAALLDARTPEGHWEGRLSTSALSTATAIIALRAAVGTHPAVERGAAWLAEHRNAGGGWGDTTDSATNISTTALAWAALGLVEPTPAIAVAIAKAEAWLTWVAGGLDGASLRRALDARYGKDRTFSVPILTALAIAGRLPSWRHVPQLPFELAAAPHQLFASLRLPVVSYALPALIAIGQARHAARPTRNPATWISRTLTRDRTLATLRAIQPSTGGFLEATPLTSFVVMSLAALGSARPDTRSFRLAVPPLAHPAARDVVADGVAFLLRSVREDGSWPIDTNLATWVTTLSIEALAADGRGVSSLMPDDDRERLVAWILRQQYRVEHPYTHAAPGAWAWTDLAGGVPDADDTAGALVALAHLADPSDAHVREAAAAGVTWLLDLQNRDGGMPTFCRGWTGLPFDRSGADLTAHAVRAWWLWRRHVPAAVAARVGAALQGAGRYLTRVQHDDGAFAPLWFGNESAPAEVNLTYGTAKVLPALHALADAGIPGARERASRAARWLAAAQCVDGGWSGYVGPHRFAATGTAARASIEETALAVAALAGHAARDTSADLAPIRRGLDWLRQATDEGRVFPASPIGLYFARLWYSEALYPLIFTVAAVQAAEAVLGREPGR
jgi:squalene-hopene/tetraprenyl-beta-curcumene cyclase